MDWATCIENQGLSCQCVITLILNAQTLIAAIFGSGVAIWFYFQRIKLDKQAFTRDLFTRFNERYDVINDKLEKLRVLEINLAYEESVGEGQGMKESIEDAMSEPGPKLHAVTVIEDYLNLCSEEYFWFKKGYVEPAVWNCWNQGMLFWLKELEAMKVVVTEEQSRGTKYYNADFLELFVIK